ncbi:ethanolamine ammonia-lyase subunit EutC [Edaphobacter modestus]|uniref:Ethanolamine ammonia-lyase small subunit n=1 Tax=Edaphobacter modestus TaxID=388466 RepID=A0A4V2G3Y0_9BACT|nr:ethanolamine ammonia-lyase subunit EutC [Edaphobacter modestus]RZU38826.1 ethanolamine ammonia-lyase light chain [Edaphobacter modestus]
MSESPSRVEPWHSLTQWTSARIAMGRAGASMPTASVLEFNSDHALARDAIHTALDTFLLERRFAAAGFRTLSAWSRARDRSEYLRRPDLGRSLDPACVPALRADDDAQSATLTVVVADGLSALAPASHALPLLELLRDGLAQWTLDPVVIATQARVALGDEIGQLRRAEAVLVLIGERPGLKSPDSLGAYLTYLPRAGRMDSERNCVSNIRPAGLTYDQAVFRLLHLLTQARVLGATGVSLKDGSDTLRELQETDRPRY